MKNRNSSLFVTILSLSIVSFTFQNCGDAAFTESPAPSTESNATADQVTPPTAELVSGIGAQEAAEGDSITLSVEVTSNASQLRYEWFVGPAQLPYSSFSAKLRNLKDTDAGTYRVNVYGDGQLLLSDEGTLDVLPNAEPGLECVTVRESLLGAGRVVAACPAGYLITGCSGACTGTSNDVDEIHI